MTEANRMQFNSYVTRLVSHGARDHFGNVRGRLARSAAEIERLKRCLSFREAGDALADALAQASEAYLLADKQYELIRLMMQVDSVRSNPALGSLLAEVLSAKRTGQILELRDKERDVKLLTEIAKLLVDGASVQELIENRMNGHWVPEVS